MREAASHGLTVVRLQPQGKRLQNHLQPCAVQALIDWLDAPADARRQRDFAVRDRAAVAGPGWVTVNHLLLERDDGRLTGSRADCCWSLSVVAHRHRSGRACWPPCCRRRTGGGNLAAASGAARRNRSTGMGNGFERLAWSLTLAGLAGLSQRSPRRDGSGPAVGPSRSAPTGGAAHRPASLLSRWLMSTIARQGRGGGHLQPDRRAVQRRTLPAYHRRRRASGGRADCTPRSAAWSWPRLMAPSAVRWDGAVALTLVRTLIS
ncbi:general secretion pathway protein M [Klebsiella pneumoniae]|uniref:General secretion pathway protein M n=1 Tax=Klebsiella pneumoniae TaxID=573 RepID=A0A377TLN8_KLEPN|nr:general secretion pathway protein M [Klebsiella pneumoniae]